MREHRSCASREGALLTTLDPVASKAPRRSESTRVSEFDDRRIEAAAQEWKRVLDDARRADPAALRILLCEFEDGPLPEHRTRVIQITASSLESVQTLHALLWSDSLSGSDLNLHDYRISRNDFDLLKGRYLDIFELAYHSLVFTARVANVARRGCAARHANGYNASLRQALGYSRPLEREHWLIDFPIASQLYARLKRATRNDISHGRLRCDYQRGELVYRDGRRGTCVEFLVDYLHAVRLTHYLIDVLVGLGLTTREICDGSLTAGKPLVAGACRRSLAVALRGSKVRSLD